MGQDPAAIREEIEQTRERMGSTVDALGYKADVPARTKESIGEKVDAVKSKLTGAGSQLSDSAPSSDDVRHGAKQAVGVAQENPLGLAIGAAAFGFLAGMLIPSTSIENKQIGPVADQVKGQLSDTAEAAIEHGKQLAQETVQTAADKAQETAQVVQEKAQEAAAEVKDQAQESAQKHAEEVKQTAQEGADEVKQSAQSSTSPGAKPGPQSPASASAKPGPQSPAPGGKL